MGCMGCKKGKVSETIRAMRLDQGVKELALERAVICDGCKYLASDMTCRAALSGTLYIPSAVKHPRQRCPFRLW